MVEVGARPNYGKKLSGGCLPLLGRSLTDAEVSERSGSSAKEVTNDLSLLSGPVANIRVAKAIQQCGRRGPMRRVRYELQYPRQEMLEVIRCTDVQYRQVEVV